MAAEAAAAGAGGGGEPHQEGDLEQEHALLREQVARQAECLEVQRAQLAAMQQSLETKQVAMAKVQKQLARVRAVKAAGGTKVWRDWGSKYGEGLPEKVMEKIARKVSAGEDADCVSSLRRMCYSEPGVRLGLEKRKAKGHSLFGFAMVCKGWRKVQLKVGGGLFTSTRDIVWKGRPRLVEWALAEGCPVEDQERSRTTIPGPNDFAWTIQDCAASAGRLDLLKWLCAEKGYERYRRRCSRLMRFAANSGQVAIVKWLREAGCPWDERLCYESARRGHLELLQHARQHGCPWDAWTAAVAAEAGHLKLLKWARANGCPIDAWTTAHAARGGHLEVLQYLRSEGCEWDENTCSEAAEKGHLDCLKWARRNGCPWNGEDCYDLADDQKHEEMCKWIASHAYLYTYLSKATVEIDDVPAGDATAIV